MLWDFGKREKNFPRFPSVVNGEDSGVIIDCQMISWDNFMPVERVEWFAFQDEAICLLSVESSTSLETRSS